MAADLCWASSALQGDDVASWSSSQTVARRDQCGLETEPAAQLSERLALVEPPYLRGTQFRQASKEHLLDLEACLHGYPRWPPMRLPGTSTDNARRASPPTLESQTGT
jgi:hypothetical protein